MRAPSCLSALLALGLLLAAGTLSSVYAQLDNGDIPGAGSIATGQQSAAGKKAAPVVAEPASVPGSKPNAPVAPATRPIGDMAPNEALFDAINRGDIAAARDALNRGADLSARNILGMTPIDLSVDLGRNDITFLLLSMRGDDGGSGSRGAARPSFPLAAPSAPVRTVKAARLARNTRAAKPARAMIRPIRAPKLFANDGGTPVPSAGFLGFASR